MNNEQLDIKTCIKQDDMFVPINEINRADIKNPHYIDGSIRINVGNKPLITDEEWTDIVHWWASMYSVVRDLVSRRRDIVEIYFPDSAAKMRFTRDAGRLIWEINSAQSRSANLDFSKSIKVIASSYNEAFYKFKVLNPICAHEYEIALLQFAKLQIAQL